MVYTICIVVAAVLALAGIIVDRTIPMVSDRVDGPFIEGFQTSHGWLAT